MKTLASPRVLVIDDQEQEARPLLEALWSRGIPVVHSKGLPPIDAADKLSGVRLIFLDLHLQGTGGAHQNLTTTLGLLDQIVDLSQPGIGVVYWTKTPEQRTQFEALIKERLTHFSPAYLIPQDKIQFLTSGTGAMEDLAASIESSLTAQVSHSFLCGWESSVLRGAIATSQSLFEANMAEEKRMRVLATLARAAGGKSIESDRHAVSLLCETMHELLADAIPPREFVDTLEPFGAVLREAIKLLRASPLSTDECSRLNRLLILDPAPDEVLGDVPGALLYGHTTCPIGTRRAFSESAIRGELMEYFISQCAGRAPEDCKAWKDELRKAAVDAIQVWANVTPPCDVAQQRQFLQYRYVGGVLLRIPVPAFLLFRADLPPEARTFAKELPAIRLQAGPRGEGTYLLLLNARQLYGVDRTTARSQKPDLVLRSSVVNELLAWFASHAARPGIISV